MRIAYCRTGEGGWPASGGPPEDWFVARLRTSAEFVEALREHEFDAALVFLDDPNRLTETLSRARAAAPELPIVVAAPAGREAEAAAAGAADYWLDAMSPLRLRFALEQAVYRRRSSALLAAREEALERVDDAVVVTDAEERIVSWNRAAARLYGYRADEVLGALLPETLSPLWLDPETRLKAWRAVAAHGVWLGETEHARRDGSPVRVSVEIAAARDAFGGRRGLLLVARPAAGAPAPAADPAARDPRDARLFLERILNAIADPVFVKDRSYRMIFVNDALCALTGVSREQMLGRTDYDFLPAGQADVFRRQDDLVFSTGRENVNEETVTDARGMTHVLITKKTVWRDAEGRPFLAGVIRDVTEIAKTVEDLRRSQEQLRRAQRLELVGRLAGGVAHDFNNVLTAIIGCANLALESLAPSHAARDDVHEIRRAGEHARDLTRQLLSFSRRPEGRPQVLDLRELYGGMRKMLERLLPARIDLVYRLPERLGMVRVDPGQAEQVLLNLVINAGDAMPDGGRVVVELADAREGGAGLAAPCVRLTVSDSGVGMDAPTRAAIFEPFFTTKPEGTGLGLSNVRDVVARGGGAVEVESEPEKGSSFRVFWPRCERAKARAKPRRPSRARAEPQRVRVLVVEDDEAVRRFAVRCLKDAGFEVLGAADGVAALRLSDARKTDFDVAVVDVVLPRMLGPEFVERMRARRPKTKVLYISGQFADPIVRDCAENRAEAFLPKPFGAPELAERVRALAASDA
jgi:PAS domain S-box-containing protein